MGYAQSNRSSTSAVYSDQSTIFFCLRSFFQAISMARLAALFLLGLVAFEIAIAKRDLNSHKSKFDDFKKKHGKKYKDQREHNRRFNIFSSNLAKIEAHNAAYEAGKESFHVGVNKFADLSAAEASKFLGFRRSPDTEFKVNRAARSLSNAHLAERMKRQSVPASMDWRNKSAVSPVKDQGLCGSCWTFSTTGVLESAIYIKKKSMVLLSEQNLVDCVPDDDTYQCSGCDGGFADKALQWIKDQNNAIDTESSYPYEAQDDTCRFNPANDGLTYSITGIAQTKSGDENALKATVGLIGPVTAYVYAGHWRFMGYTGGVFIYDCCDNDPNAQDHAVLIVGYGTDAVHGDYWLVKNSWGTTDWGEQGYMRLARNRNNTCGIALENYYPILA